MNVPSFDFPICSVFALEAKWQTESEGKALFVYNNNEAVSCDLNVNCTCRIKDFAYHTTKNHFCLMWNHSDGFVLGSVHKIRERKLQCSSHINDVEFLPLRPHLQFILKAQAPEPLSRYK